MGGESGEECSGHLAKGGFGCWLVMDVPGLDEFFCGEFKHGALWLLVLHLDLDIYSPLLKLIREGI